MKGANRIDDKFAALKAQGRKALITFVMAGDPDEAAFVQTLDSLPASGADLIEIGMPFTDPGADGPAIQAAGLRALQSGMTLKRTLELVQQFRVKHEETPVILMGYMNPILAYGVKNFTVDAAQCGVDGVIIVDLPPEEADEIAPYAAEVSLDLIRLITPTTTQERLQKILQGASGFLYYVSITGVTGTKSADTAEVGKHIAQIRQHTNLPIAVGFGIKTSQDAAKMGTIADAVVVGSALIESGNIPEKVQSLAKALAA